MTSRCRASCSRTFRDKLYVPEFKVPCCEPVNQDGRRFERYQAPVVSRTEPLSHHEYLRILKANGGKPVSKSTVVSTGEGIYKQQIWTSAVGNCCEEDKVLPPVPPAQNPQDAKDAWMYDEMKGAVAGRGTISKFDQVNRTEDITRLRHQGLAILSVGDTITPAGGEPVMCPDCTLTGTIYVTPGPKPCGCKSSQAVESRY